MAKVVVKDFYADWCPPCKMMKPVIESLEDEYKGRVEFKKINIDSEQKEAMKYGVKSIPTIVIEKEGKMLDSFVGMQAKEVLKRAIDKVLT